MRVIYVLSSTQLSGGSTKSFLNLVVRLRDAGVEPLVIVRDGGGVCARLKEIGIAYRVLSFRLGFYPPTDSLKDILLFAPRLIGRLYVNQRATRLLCAIARRFGADLIHSNVGVVTIGYDASRRMRLPHVWHIREYGDKYFDMHYYPTRRSHLRALQQPLSYSICISRDIAAYNGLTGCSQSRVIYNGIVEEAKSGDQAPIAKENFFLFVGRIERGKGILELIEAYKQSLPRMSQFHRLLLAGKAEDQKYYNQLTDSLALLPADSVVLLGEIADVGDYMRRAKAVVVSSELEGFGRVMPEAMSVNTLVIARDAAGSKEQFDNGLKLTGEEIGLRYSTREELADRIVQVASTPQEYYSDMLSRAYRTVYELYSNEQNATKVLAFYKDILNQ
ncbi:MAG: glycosyltransferase [Paludibacteraceae bacterium]|nr:glycosyltransferase [Paludibacteraceae bacterium]